MDFSEECFTKLYPQYFYLGVNASLNLGNISKRQSYTDVKNMR